MKREFKQAEGGAVFTSAIHTSTLMQLELRTRIRTLRAMHLNAPFDFVIPSITTFYEQKGALHQRLIDIMSTFVGGPRDGVDYLDGQQAVLYRSRMNPPLGRNFEAMYPLEWLARLSDHIPDPGQHRTLFYGEYSNRVRGSGHPGEPEAPSRDEPTPPRWTPKSGH